MSWAEINTLAGYEDLRNYPMAILMVTKRSDDATRRIEAENYLISSLPYQGISFKRVNKETIETSKGCAKLFDFTITPTIHFLLKGKLAERPSRLATANGLVNRIREYIESKTKVYQIQNIEGFSRFIASRLAILMFYDTSIPRMAGFLDGLSIAFPNVQFGIANSANQSINNSKTVPRMLSFPSILVYRESTLAVQAPIELTTLVQYLENSRAHLSNPSFKIDHYTLRDDLKAVMDSQRISRRQSSVPSTSVARSRSSSSRSDNSVMLELPLLKTVPASPECSLFYNQLATLKDEESSDKPITSHEFVGEPASRNSSTKSQKSIDSYKCGTQSHVTSRSTSRELLFMTTSSLQTSIEISIDNPPSTEYSFRPLTSKKSNPHLQQITSSCNGDRKINDTEISERSNEKIVTTTISRKSSLRTDKGTDYGKVEDSLSDRVEHSAMKLPGKSHQVEFAEFAEYAEAKIAPSRQSSVKSSKAAESIRQNIDYPVEFTELPKLPARKPSLKTNKSTDSFKRLAEEGQTDIAVGNTSGKTLHFEPIDVVAIVVSRPASRMNSIKSNLATDAFKKSIEEAPKGPITTIMKSPEEEITPRCENAIFDPKKLKWTALPMQSNISPFKPIPRSEIDQPPELK